MRIGGGVRQMARGALAVLALALLGALVPASAAAAKKKGKPVPPITISGTVYTFDNQEPIPGATVRVAELPTLSAVSGSDGSYSLTIPGGTKFTPYADAPDHHRIYLQTWVSQGKNLRGVNFQMPTQGIYELLAAVVGAPRGPDGELVDCAVVSTFVNEAVRDLTFDEFVAFGAHGVAGATGTAIPELPPPIYFNESVIPDRSLTSSTVDGGVVWPIVPKGEFFFFGEHPSRRFAPFRATCMAGRVVNANPVQGLYELRPGEEVDRNVRSGTDITLPGPYARRPRIKVRVKASEYVRVTVRVFAGKKQIRKRATRGWSPGTKRFTFPISRKIVIGAHRVVVRVEDGEGNARTSELGSSKIEFG
jgi:hypothetical protein